MKPDFFPWCDESRSRKYFEATADRPAHAVFDVLDPYLPSAGRALDLGCGAGRGTLRLLSRGLSVTAVDMSAEGLEFLRERLPLHAPATLVCSTFADLELKEQYDVVVACCSLFFLPPKEFGDFLPRVFKAIVPGGLFAGQLLGVNDTWKNRPFTTHSRAGVEALLSELQILHLNEEERDGETATGEPKHWHVFDVIAAKPR